MRSHCKPVPCAILALVLIACESSNTAPASTDKKTLLVASKWRMTAQSVYPGMDLDGSGTLVTDFFTTAGPCLADDVMSFAADGKWSTDDGALKCDPLDPQVVTGTWSMNAARDSITLTTTGEAAVERYKVEALTAEEFKVYAITDGLGDGEMHLHQLAFKAL